MKIKSGPRTFSRRSIFIIAFFWLLFNSVSSNGQSDSITALNKIRIDVIVNSLNASINDLDKITKTLELIRAAKKDSPETALKHIPAAISIAEKQENRFLLAGLYLSQAELQGNLGEYESGLKSAFLALGISEEIKSDSLTANSLNQIGKYYKIMGLFDLAIRHHEKALPICKSLSDSACLASTYNQLGNAWYKKNNKILAKDYYQKSLDIAEKAGLNKQVSAVSNNLANIFKDEKNYNKALLFYTKALKISEAIHDEYGTAFYQNNIGSLYNEMGNPELALGYGLRALETAKRLKENVLLVNTHAQVGKIYMSLKKYDSAYYYSQEYASIIEKVFTENSAKQINELQAKYETEKKQKEIEYLIKEKKAGQLIKYYLAGGLLVLFLLVITLFNRYRIKNKANTKLSLAYNIIEEKNRNITDSIQYAKRIQEAILPPRKFFSDYFPNSFVLYKPKDIVSGDFYWLEKKGGHTLVAVVDCTGHGVPGAFMSIVTHNGLTRAVNEHNLTKPSAILDFVNKTVHETLRQNAEESTMRDGADLVLCSVNEKDKKLEFSGANNPLIIIRNNKLIEIKADKQPIGVFVGNKPAPFTCHSVDFFHGDTIYLFTDGYSDQFGGEEIPGIKSGGKKFKYTRLKELLLSLSDKPMDEQKNILYESFEKWKGSLEQVDDVCIIGIKL